MAASILLGDFRDSICMCVCVHVCMCGGSQLLSGGGLTAGGLVLGYELAQAA